MSTPTTVLFTFLACCAAVFLVAVGGIMSDQKAVSDCKTYGATRFNGAVYSCSVRP